MNGVKARRYQSIALKKKGIGLINWQAIMNKKKVKTGAETIMAG